MQTHRIRDPINTNVIDSGVDDAGAVSVDGALLGALLVGHTHVATAALLHLRGTAAHADVHASRRVHVAALHASNTFSSCELSFLSNVHRHMTIFVFVFLIIRDSVNILPHANKSTVRQNNQKLVR